MTKSDLTITNNSEKKNISITNSNNETITIKYTEAESLANQLQQIIRVQKALNISLE